MTELDIVVVDGGLVLADADGRPPRVASLADVQDQTGLVTTILEPLEPSVVVLELHSGTPTAPYRFVAPDRIRHPLVRPYLSRRPSPVPWFRPGWLAEAVAWIDAVRPGRTGDVEQVQNWSMSSVLRVPYADRTLYFKAVQPLVAREPLVIEAVAAEHPDSVPQIVVSDRDRGWWLSADFGGSWVPPAERSGVLRTLAAIQRSFAKDTDALAAAGCPVLDADALAARVPALMAREQLWIEPGRAAPPGRTLSAAERLRWADFAVDLSDRCAELGELDLPLTLVHGDFHPNNAVRRGDGGFVLFDWSFAAVSYPLLDLGSWLHEEGSEAVAAQHLSAYAQGWGEARIRTAWRAARPVAALMELLKFVDLADAVGADHAFDFEPMAYAWVRRLVAAVDGADAGRIGFTPPPGSAL